MKNILVLNFEAKVGGAEKVLITNCKILSEEYNIFVVLNKKGLLEENIDLYCRKKYLFLVRSKISALAQNKRINQELEEIINKHKIDLIYINSIKSMVLYLPVLKRRNEPMILHIHDNINFSFFKFWATVIKYAMKSLSPQIITISNYSRQFIPKKLKSVTVLNNTSPLIKDKIPEFINSAEKQFLMVGRITPWKGQLEVLKIMKNRLINDKNIHLSFVGGPLFGETSYYNQLIKFTRKNNLEEKITFYDQIEDENKIIELYCQADFVIHASIKPEPFGLVILEAIMFGKIIIGSKYGAAPEIIQDGINGFIIDPLDIDSCQKKINNILTLSKPEIDNIKQNALETYQKHYSYQVYRKKLLNIFQLSMS